VVPYRGSFPEKPKWVEMSEEFKSTIPGFSFHSDLRKLLMESMEMQSVKKYEMVRSAFESKGFKFPCISLFNDFLKERVMILNFSADWWTTRSTFCVDEKPLFNLWETRFSPVMSENQYVCQESEFKIEYLDAAP
jgi:hypothetical protein